jgi:hypothetical protein
LEGSPILHADIPRRKASNASANFNQNLNAFLSTENASRSSQSSPDGHHHSLSHLPTVTDFGFQAAESDAGPSPADAEREARGESYTCLPAADLLPSTSLNLTSGVGSGLVSPKSARASLDDDALIDTQESTYVRLDDVKNDLRHAIAHSVGPDSKLPRFLPLDKLRSIVNDNVIADLIRDIYPEDYLEKAQEITSPGKPDRSMRRVFTLLVLVGKIETVSMFIDNNVRDSDLPLVFIWKSKRYDVRKRSSKRTADSKPLRFF